MSLWLLMDGGNRWLSCNAMASVVDNYSLANLSSNRIHGGSPSWTIKGSSWVMVELGNSFTKEVKTINVKTSKNSNMSQNPSTVNKGSKAKRSTGMYSHNANYSVAK